MGATGVAKGKEAEGLKSPKRRGRPPKAKPKNTTPKEPSIGPAKQAKRKPRASPRSAARQQAVRQKYSLMLYPLI